MALDFPSNPVNNQVYGNYYYDSSIMAWRASGSISAIVPSGVVSQYMGNTAPSGYLLCLGQSVLVSDYPALFSVIGYNYGGSGLNFTIPNMQGRVPVGKASSGTFNVSLTSAAVGGTETVTLDATQIPAHSHPNTATVSITGGAHTHQMQMAGGGAPSGTLDAPLRGSSTFDGSFRTQFESTGSAYGSSLGTHSHSGTVTMTNANNTGGGGSHNNLQPYIVVNYIIKT